MPEDHQGLSEEEARELSRRVLSFSSADHARVNIEAGWRGFTRSATNRIVMAGGHSDVTVAISSVFGKRVASVTTNDLQEDSLRQRVRDSEALARLAPEDPEYLPELGMQNYEAVNGYYASTAGLTPETRAESVALAIREADESKTVAAGYVDVRAGTDTVATSNGLFGHAAGTGVASTLTIRTPDGSSSGWAGDEAADWSEIESERVAADAVRKCRMWRGKTALDPGRYTVILEPTAAGMLMLRMTGAFNARQADEGRSYFSRPGGSNRIGEKLFDSRISLTSDPNQENAQTSPFTDEGVARRRVVWVEDGVLKNLAYERFWAQKQGVEARPSPANLIMKGGETTVEEMIGATERGVLITRFWYIRGLNPRTLSYTGLCRDGTFLIENGQISRPVNNFRFNQSLVEMLNNVEALAAPTRVAAGENSSVGTPIVVPAMKVRDFNLSSVSDAI